MADVSQADADYNLWVLLHQVRDLIFEARETELRQYGITTMQAAVLFIIQAVGDGATPAAIARWLFRRPHTVSGILERMEEAGLVTRTKDLGKKNQVRIAITHKGRKAYKESMKRRPIRRVFSVLSANERQQLWSLLRALRDRSMKEAGLNPWQKPFPTSMESTAAEG